MDWVTSACTGFWRVLLPFPFVLSIRQTADMPLSLSQLVAFPHAKQRAKTASADGSDQNEQRSCPGACQRARFVRSQRRRYRFVFLRVIAAEAIGGPAPAQTCQRQSRRWRGRSRPGTDRWGGGACFRPLDDPFICAQKLISNK